VWTESREIKPQSGLFISPHANSMPTVCQLTRIYREFYRSVTDIGRCPTFPCGLRDESDGQHVRSGHDMARLPAGADRSGATAPIRGLRGIRNAQAREIRMPAMACGSCSSGRRNGSIWIHGTEPEDLGPDTKRVTSCSRPSATSSGSDRHHRRHRLAPWINACRPPPAARPAAAPHRLERLGKARCMPRCGRCRSLGEKEET
jgi:hypothetical protein